MEELEEMHRYMEEMMRGAEERGLVRTRRTPYGEIREFGPFVYGFSVRIGPDGKPEIQEFGNVVPRRFGRPEIREEREPIVDVYEEDEEVRVIAELPGVSKDDIELRVLDERRLVIKASGEERKYYKEVDLPCPVDPDSAKAAYRNGILDVKLKKRAKPEGRRVKIE